MAILGIDEVGRGPLAGPLVVGAVVLPEDEREWFAELRDSKKLSAKKREVLNEVILKEAVTGLGWVSSSELDSVGISEALRLATRRAVKSLKGLHAVFSQIVIDGKVNFLKLTELEKYVSTMPKADDLIREVSAASIIAKVARDHYMYELAEKYPDYGFEKNVGYGTAKHLKAINEYGICEEHRRSFEPIKSMVGFSRSLNSVKNVVKNTTDVGLRGEEAVSEYLERLGHKIVVRNFKTKFYEIDIISVFKDKVYFTEVKTRGSLDFGGGIGAVDKRKLDRMKFAVENFMKFRAREFEHFSPILAVGDVDGEFRVRDWFTIN